jgi:Permeases of the drug/metabolite transporter (DMT) superfamily
MPAAILIALAAAALFGAATPLSKLLLGSMSPFALAGLLYLGAGAALAPAALRGGIASKLRRQSRENKLLVLGSILCGGIAGPLLLLFGLRLAKSASTSLWLNLELVATTLLGHFFFKDRMTRSSAVAAFGVLAASVLLSFEGESSIAGGLFVAAACLMWGFDNHFTALIDGLKPAESTFIKGIAAGATNLAIAAASGGLGLGATTIAEALALGALSYGASIVLYIESAQGLGASRAQLFFSSSPVFGILLATIVLGEGISAPQVAATIVMLGSYAFMLAERHEHAHTHEAIVHTHWHRHGEGHHDHAHESLAPLAAVFGHSHEHEHEALSHEHGHVPDAHHRHLHRA